MKILKHFSFVLFSFALLPVPIKTKLIRIYEDDFFHVDDYTLDYGGVERIFTLFFQEIHKPKRILITGLGIGIIPRALNFMLEDTLHIDIVEIGKKLTASIFYDYYSIIYI